MVQNCDAGQQDTHCDKENKELITILDSSLFVFFQFVPCFPAWRFCTTWRTSCRGPISLLKGGSVSDNAGDCRKRKLACCNFNALIREIGTNSPNLTLEFSHTINQNLTRRHAEQAHSKTCHVIYIYRTRKGITKCSRSKCQSNDSHSDYYVT